MPEPETTSVDDQTVTEGGDEGVGTEVDEDVPEIHTTPAAQSRRGATEEPCADLPLLARIESLLISADRPLSEARLAALLGIETKGAARRVREAIETINAGYDETGRAFRAERLAGGWQLLTRAEFGPLLTRMHSERQQSRLSQAALETLAILAYRQPIMRAEVEAIRGVACGEVLRGLLERRLVKITGRAEELGRPMLYGTTKEFLNVFGLSGPEDLPEVEGLEPGRRPISKPEAATPADTSPSDAAEDLSSETSPEDGSNEEPTEPSAGANQR